MPIGSDVAAVLVRTADATILMLDQSMGEPVASLAAGIAIGQSRRASVVVVLHADVRAARLSLHGIRRNGN
jgi:hypothetical protein